MDLVLVDEIENSEKCPGIFENEENKSLTD
jgi:hypothetical protein